MWFRWKCFLEAFGAGSLSGPGVTGEHMHGRATRVTRERGFRQVCLLPSGSYLSEVAVSFHLTLLVVSLSGDSTSEVLS